MDQLKYYIDKSDYNQFLEVLVSLSAKSNQNNIVIFGIVKYSIKVFYPIIKQGEDDIILLKYYDTLKNIFDSISYSEVYSYKLLKSSKTSFKYTFFQFYNNQKYDEMLNLILGYEYEDDDIVVSVLNDNSDLNNSKKLIGIDNYNTDSSTKCGKLEISTAKDLNSSTRKIQFNSPINRISSDYTNNAIKNIQNDNIRFKKKLTNKLPFLRLATDITLTGIQIKREFIKQMKEYNYYNLQVKFNSNRQ